MTVSDLQRFAASDAKLVVDLATKSKSLKGTTVRSLRDAAVSLQGTVMTLASRQQNEEVARLEAENQHLRGKMKELRGEMVTMRRSLDSLRRKTRRLLSLFPLPLRGLESRLEDEVTFVPPYAAENRDRSWPEVLRRERKRERGLTK